MKKVRRFSGSGLRRFVYQHGFALSFAKLDDWIQKGVLRNAPAGGWTMKDARHVLLLLRVEQRTAGRVSADRLCELVIWTWLYCGGWNSIPLTQVKRALWTWLQAQRFARKQQIEQTVRDLVKALLGPQGTHIRSLAALLVALGNGETTWVVPKNDLLKSERDSSLEERIRPVDAQTLFELLGVVRYGYASLSAKAQARADEELAGLAYSLVRWFRLVYQMTAEQIHAIPTAAWCQARVYNLRVIAQMRQQMADSTSLTLNALRANACERLFLLLTMLAQEDLQEPLPVLILRDEPSENPTQFSYTIRDAQGAQKVQRVELPFGFETE